MVVFVLMFLLSATSAFAQPAINFPKYPFETLYSVDALATFLGIPSEWLAIPKVIYFVIVPFIVAVSVTYGILTELNIFRMSLARRKIYIVLSISLSFLLLPSGALAYIVNYFYAFGTALGLVVFGALFILGTLMWGAGTFWRIRGEYMTPTHIAKDIRQMGKAIEYHRRKADEIQRQIDANPASPSVGTWIAERNLELRDMHELTAKQAELHAKLRQLTTT